MSKNKIQQEKPKNVKTYIKNEDDQIKNILNIIKDGIYICSSKNEIVYINPVLKKQFGPIKGKKCYEYFHGFSEPCLGCVRKEVLSGKTIRREWYFPKVNRTYDVLETPIKNPNGEISKLKIMCDITERKKIEGELKVSKKLMNRNLEIAHIGRWELDVINNVLYWSDEVYRIFGLQPQEFGATYEAFLEAVHPDDRTVVDAAYSSSLLRGEDNCEIEHRVVRKNGDIRIVHEKCEHIRDKSGKIIRLIGMIQDITERKKIEEKLRAARDRYLSTIELTGLLGWTTNANGEVVEDIPAWRKFTGQTEEEIKGIGWSKALHPDDVEHTIEVWRKAVAKKSKYEIEYRVRGYNGIYRYFLVHGAPVLNQNGSIREWVGTCIDIDDRKKMEKALITERQRLFGILDGMPMMVCLLTPDYHVAFANRAFQEKFGESHGRKCYEYCFEKREPCDFCESYQILKTRKPHHWEVKTIKGDVIDVYDYPFTDVDGTPMILEFDIDITERKKMEEKLRVSEKKYRMIVENTTNVIMVTQPDGMISYLSPSCKSVIGYSPKELIGTNPIIYHPEDKQKVQQAFSRALKGKKGFSFEYRIITKQGEIKWISHSWSPIFINNKLQSIISIIEDITNRKEIENNIKELNENLIRQAIELAAANKELEAFSYSVSHDLRAPLRSIDGFSLALLEDYSDKLDEQGKEYLQRVRNAAQRMGQLIDDMLKLSRLTRTEITIQKVDLGQIATEIVKELQKTEPTRKIKFIKHDKLIVDGDANLLHILLKNLLDNAWKFTKKRQQVEIEFGKNQHNQETVFFIRDNGVGFNMKFADKLFIPFQRLHSDNDYPGIGIGLGIVSRIIHRHGGRIWVEAKEEKGATFYFTLGEKINE